MAERNFLEELTKGIGDAVADIRQKVVEEPWYGRAVTEHASEAPQWPEAREAEASFGGVTRNIDVGPTRDQMQENANYRLAVEQERNRSPDMDIDR